MNPLVVAVSKSSSFLGWFRQMFISSNSLLFTYPIQFPFCSLDTELEQKGAVGLFHSEARVPSVCFTLVRKDELAERQIQTARKIRGHSLALALLFFRSR